MLFHFWIKLEGKLPQLEVNSTHVRNCLTAKSFQRTHLSPITVWLLTNRDTPATINQQTLASQPLWWQPRTSQLITDSTLTGPPISHDKRKRNWEACALLSVYLSGCLGKSSEALAATNGGLSRVDHASTVRLLWWILRNTTHRSASFVNHFLSPDWDYSATRRTFLLRVLVSFFLYFDVENCGWQDVNRRNWSSSLIVDGIVWEIGSTYAMNLSRIK